MKELYVVVETERHPDRFLGEAYGPYEDWDDAVARANRINDARGLYYATIMTLIPA